MITDLLEDLREYCRAKGAVLLHVCMVGSRAYGYHTPQSDVDVRFVYAFPAERYFSLTAVPDELALPERDVVGYELGKFLSMLRRNGCNAVEILQAPTLCSEYPEILPELRELGRWYFVPGCAVHSLLGGARTYVRRLHYLQEAEKGTDRERKLLLGAIRLMSAARYVLERKVPYPLSFRDLISSMEEEPERSEILALADSRRLEQPLTDDLLVAPGAFCCFLRDVLGCMEQGAQEMKSPRMAEEFYYRVVTLLGERAN